MSGEHEMKFKLVQYQKNVIKSLNIQFALCSCLFTKVSQLKWQSSKIMASAKLHLFVNYYKRNESFVSILKRRRLRVEPSGTPFIILNLEQKLLFTCFL